jgi:FMN phosphatase YigB (HAD superfamily)
VTTKRALLFDFGGTLDCPPHVPRHWLDRFLGHYRSAGIDLARDQLDVGFDYATRAAYQSTATVRNFSLPQLVSYLVRLQIERMRRVASEATQDALGPLANGYRLDETVAWITQSFVAEAARGIEYTREVIATLAGRLKMGVVSNFYGNLDRVIEEARLAGYFDAVVDSSRVGIFKPAPGIFTAALDILRVAPEAAAMLGDSLEKDCAPARRLGLTTIWLRDPTDLRSPARHARDDRAADFTIDNLAELENLKWWTD